MKFLTKYESNMYRRMTLMVRYSRRTSKGVFIFYSVDVAKIHI